MARNKKRWYHKPKMTIPLAIVAGFIPGVSNVVTHFKNDGIEGAGAEASRIFLGYASTNKYGYNDKIGFHPYLLKYGTLPVVAGFMAHWLIGGKLGVNRMLGRMGIPLVRL